MSAHRIAGTLVVPFAAIVFAGCGGGAAMPPPRAQPAQAPEGAPASAEKAAPATPVTPTPSERAPLAREPAPAPPTATGSAAPVPMPAAKSDRASDIRVALRQIEEGRAAIDAAGGDCAALCRALSSMTRAADHLCGLSGEDDRCRDARSKVAAATAKVRARCGACGS